MNKRRKTTLPATGLLLAVTALHLPVFADGDGYEWQRDERGTKLGHQLRAATFNASLNRFNAGELVADLAACDEGRIDNDQVRAVVEIIQRSDPDVLLVNEFDYDADGEAARLFPKCLAVSLDRRVKPLRYRDYFVAPSNTGIPSGYDLNNDGSVGGPDDALGFGYFPGQYGMVVYSKHPIVAQETRTFQTFLWKDMPGALLPDDLATPEPDDWYTPEELEIFRLSSKSHWDIAVRLGGEIIHILVSHPTPPVFDGPEDRNGLRNHDEIRFWADYVDPAKSDYIYDDSGHWGGLAAGAHFVIMGDQNADPFDGESTADAVMQLLGHPLIDVSVTPDSAGGIDASANQGGANDVHLGNPATDTADFADGDPGNLRADYVLPSRTLRTRGAGIFWPEADDPLYPLVGDFPFPSSDHRLVWIDVNLPRDYGRDGRDDDR
jgi:hypothetical protein